MTGATPEVPDTFVNPSVHQQRQTLGYSIACEVLADAEDRYGKRLDGAPAYLRRFKALDLLVEREHKRMMAQLERDGWFR